MEGSPDAARRQSPASGAALHPGARLGRYQVLLPLGRGGMASVWAACLQGQRGFSKLVAIKTILPHLADDAEFERMLVDEARIAARIQHANVCALHELCEEDGILFLVMEWVQGDSLAAILRRAAADRRAIELRTAVRIVADASAGLNAAHELRDENGNPLEVVHRDVSPHNILVSIDGTVKVTDFGVAKARDQLHPTTQAGVVKGKLGYMAPEQLAGGSVDRRADIFALGCVLYEAITGRRPFRGDNQAQIIRAVLERTQETIPELEEAECPRALRLSVDRALASEPSRRFQTAGEMRVELENWLVQSGPLVTEADVGRVVRERIGAFLEERRERIHTAFQELHEAVNTRSLRRSAGAAPAGEAGPRVHGEAAAAAPGTQDQSMSESELPTVVVPSETPAVAPPPFPADPASSPKRRRQIAGFAVLAMTVAGTGAVLGSWGKRSHAPAIPTAAAVARGVVERPTPFAQTAPAAAPVESASVVKISTAVPIDEDRRVPSRSPEMPSPSAPGVLRSPRPRTAVPGRTPPTPAPPSGRPIPANPY